MSTLAHGGGVPEAAMIGLPLLLFGTFLLLERRARRRAVEVPAEVPVDEAVDEAVDPEDDDPAGTRRG